MSTVLDIQTAIANEVDQDDSAPTQGGTDWNIRLNLINRANRDWAEVYDWSVLKKVFNGNISTASGNASYQLPGDFQKFDGIPVVNGYQCPVLDPSKNYRYTDTDNYVNEFPKVMFIHQGTLASGASVQFTYYSSPASLVSAGQLVECPDPSYLTQRVLYYLYKGREDGRFPEADVASERILSRMIEKENVRPFGYADHSMDRGTEKSRSFRIGRD